MTQSRAADRFDPASRGDEQRVTTFGTAYRDETNSSDECAEEVEDDVDEDNDCDGELDTDDDDGDDD